MKLYIITHFSYENSNEIYLTKQEAFDRIPKLVEELINMYGPDDEFHHEKAFSVFSVGVIQVFFYHVNNKNAQNIIQWA